MRMIKIEVKNDGDNNSTITENRAANPGIYHSGIGFLYIILCRVSFIRSLYQKNRKRVKGQ